VEVSARSRANPWFRLNRSRWRDPGTLWRLLYEAGFIRRIEETNHGDPVWYLLDTGTEPAPFHWVRKGGSDREAGAKDQTPDGSVYDHLAHEVEAREEVVARHAPRSGDEAATPGADEARPPARREGEARREGGDMIPRVTRAPMLCEPSTRPHEAPDCSCRGCVIADVGADLMELFERFFPYEPKWAPTLRQIHNEVEREQKAFDEKWGDTFRQMAREAAQWPNRMLASLLREEQAKEGVVHREIPDAVLVSARPRDDEGALPKDAALLAELRATFPDIRFIVNEPNPDPINVAHMGIGFIGATWTQDGKPHQMDVQFCEPYGPTREEARAEFEKFIQATLEAYRAGRQPPAVWP
jgi:hypothetical protein